jgi:hypothetical protein
MFSRKMAVEPTITLSGVDYFNAKVVTDAVMKVTGKRYKPKFKKMTDAAGVKIITIGGSMLVDQRGLDTIVDYMKDNSEEFYSRMNKEYPSVQKAVKTVMPRMLNINGFTYEMVQR